MPRTIAPNGIGDGEESYVVRTFCIVEVISQPVKANNPIAAAVRAAKATDFPQLLRNLVGNKQVKQVEYVELDGSEVLNYEELDGKGFTLDTVMTLDKKDLDDLIEPVRRKKKT